MEKVTYKKIAECIGKTEGNIKYLAKTNKPLVEILKLGVFCKLNNITLFPLMQFLQEKEMRNEVFNKDEDEEEYEF